MPSSIAPWPPPGRRTRCATVAMVPTEAYSPSWRGTRRTRSSPAVSTGRGTSIVGKTTVSSSGMRRREDKLRSFGPRIVASATVMVILARGTQMSWWLFVVGAFGWGRVALGVGEDDDTLATGRGFALSRLRFGRRLPANCVPCPGLVAPNTALEPPLPDDDMSHPRYARTLGPADALRRRKPPGIRLPLVPPTS